MTGAKSSVAADFALCGTIPGMLRLLYITLTVFLCGLPVAPVYAGDTDLFAVGGNAETVSSGDDSIIVKSANEHWFSVPFEIPEEGGYRLSVSRSGGGNYAAYIDGEKYGKLGSDGAIRPFKIEAGSHSLILYASASAARTQTWGPVTVTGLDEAPAGTADLRSRPAKLENGAKVMQIGSMFTGSYINVNIARDSALFTRLGYQYLSYYNPEGFLVVARRKSGSGYFEKYWVPISGNKIPIAPKTENNDLSLANPHNYISMQMDSQGYIHLAYGQHNSNIKYMRSAHPYSINQWVKPQNSPGQNNSAGATYVSFFKAGDRLFSMYRLGPHGRGDQVLYSYNTSNKKWEPLHTPFVSDDGRASPYFFRPAVAHDGTIHLFWTWRLNSYGAEIEDNPVFKNDFSGFVNTDIYHARSSDYGKTWMSSGGVVYKLPIKRNTDGAVYAEQVANIPIGEDYFNHFGSATDRTGRPYIVYTKRDDESGVAQQWLTHWNGHGWKTNKVTDYKQEIAWTRQQQNGHSSTDLVRPSLLIAPDGRTLVFSRTKEFSNRIKLYISGPQNYITWRPVTLFDGPVGGWEPQFDPDRWDAEGVISLLLVGVTDRAVYEAFDEDSEPWTLGRQLQKSGHDLQRFFTALWQKATKGEVEGIDYYSDDTQVDILPVDRRLSHDTGYLMEIPYSELP